MNRGPVNLTELRERAERAIARSHAATDNALPGGEPWELGKLIEELRVYQAELEIQNQELNAAQQEITQALGKYRSLYENLPLPALLVDTLGFIVESNQLAADRLGLNRLNSLNRMSVFQLFESDSRTPLYAALQDKDMATGQSRSLRDLWLRIGRELSAPFDVNLIRLGDPEGEGWHTLLVLVDKSADHALRESEHHFRSFTDSSLVLIRATDADQRVNYVNGGWLSFTGLNEQQALAGNSWAERLHPGEVGRVLQTFADCFERRDVFRMDYRLRRHDGVYRWIRDEGTPYRDSTGRFVGYVDHCQDIHDLIEARQSQAKLTGELRLNEERLRLAMEATRDGLWDWNIQTGRTFYSPAWFRMLGYEPGDLVDKAGTAELWSDLLHPEEREDIQRRMFELLRTAGGYDLEFRLRCKNGSYRCINSRGKVVERAADGTPIRAIGTHTDITERRRMQRELAEKHGQLEKMTANIPGAVYEFELLPDGRARMPWTSAVGQRLFGLDPDTIKDDITPLFQRIHPEDLPGLQAEIQASAQTLQPFSASYRLRDANGAVRWLISNSNPEPKPDGSILWYGYTQDITERREEEQRQAAQQAAIRELNERLTKIAARVPGAIVQYRQRPDGSACFPYASEGIWDIYRLTPEEVRDDAGPVFAMVHPDDLEAVRASIEESARTLTNWQLEYRVRFADGTVRWLAGNSSPEPEADGGVLWHGYITDITARKAAEAELRSASLYARSLIEASLDPLVTIGLMGQIMDVNTATERVTGYSRDNLIASDFSGYFTEPEQARAGYQLAFAQGSVTNYPLVIRHADGHVTEVLYNASVYRDEAGEVAGVFAAARDVTERNHAEAQIRELNASLEQKVAERTQQLAMASAAKSEFLAHMSHEIRTPMNAVLGFAQVLEQEPLNPEQASLVRHIRESGQSLLHIINDILDFSKIEAGQLRLEPAPFALDTMLVRVAALLEASARNRGIDLVVESPPVIPGQLLGDDLRIKQVLINLVSNAIKFTEEGRVDLRIIPIVVEDRQARLRFEVRDTGIGIGPEALSKLFQPFSQADGSITRRFGGTGLGLSISRRLVELMGGTIGADSVQGEGSTFWFELPLQRVGEDEPEAGAVTPAPARRSGPRLSGMRVLVVDDNRMNLLLVESALKREGVETTLASDGQQALEILRARPGYFQVVVMDVQMPVMDGLSATRAIRADAALRDLPVIAFTAGVLPEERQAALAAGVNDFLAKPVDLEQLHQVLAPYRNPVAAD